MSWVAAALIIAAAVSHHDELAGVLRAQLALHTPEPTTAKHDAMSAAAVAAPKRSGRSVTLSADRSGHYFAEATINGRAIDTLVDTGATIVALSAEDAARLGLHLRSSDFTGRVSTANGTARVARVLLDRVEIGGITVRDVEATVSEPGVLTKSLLGMSFLSRLTRVDMRQGTLVLTE